MSIEPDSTAVSPYEPPTGPIAGATNGFAIASLILGILGLTWFPLIPSVLALIFGYKGKHEIDASGGVQQGRGLAVAGIVLGWIAIGLLLLVAAIAAILISVGVATNWGAVGAFN